MPIITINGSHNISKETKKQLIETVSADVAEAYGMPIESIHVIINENYADNVGVGGRQLSELKK